MTVNVLFVCTANVCRSPTAQLLMGRHLAQAGLLDDFEVASAGFHINPGQRWCPRAAGWVRRRADTRGLLDSHQPRSISPTLIDEADLIIGMERTHRSGVVHLVPGAIQRVFTVREAGTLSRAITDRLKKQRSSTTGADGRGHLRIEEPPTSGTTAARVQWLFAELNAARGLVPPPRRGHSPLQRLQRNAEDTHLDIIDPHTAKGARHRPVLTSLDSELTAIVGAIELATPQVNRHRS